MFEAGNRPLRPPIKTPVQGVPERSGSGNAVGDPGEAIMSQERTRSTVKQEQSLTPKQIDHAPRSDCRHDTVPEFRRGLTG